MAKFTAISLISVMGFQTAFNPNKESAVIPNFRLIYGLGIPKFCSHGQNYYMGADSMAGAICYLALFYMKINYTVLLGFMAFDFAYFGPQGMGGPVAGMIGAMTLL